MERLNVFESMTCSQMCDLPEDMLESVDGVSKKKMLKLQEYTQGTVKVSNVPA